MARRAIQYPRTPPPHRQHGAHWPSKPPPPHRPQDKVNLSVAIIPMAHDFGWSPSVAGLVQSSFFW